mmetsp:Transcript_16082/g.26864  ORF Transcript_16082/g.26864 Transcript_16082/m.26864 type:complete len:265 (+) Transcript_16082:92-886(+)
MTDIPVTIIYLFISTRRAPSWGSLILLFLFNLLDNGFNGFLGNHGLLSSLTDNTNLHRLGTTIDNFQQCLNRQTRALRLLHLFRVIFLQKFSQRLAVAPSNDLRLPSRMRTSRVRLIEFWNTIVSIIDTTKEGRNTKGSDSSTLGVLLLDACQIPCEVVNGRSILHGEAVGLSFHANFGNQDAGIGREASKGQDGAIVDGDNFANSAGFLEFGQGPSFHCQDNAILSLDANSSRTSSNSFHSIFDLKEMTIRREHGNSTIVRHD